MGATVATVRDSDLTSCWGWWAAGMEIDSRGRANNVLDVADEFTAEILTGTDDLLHD